MFDNDIKVKAVEFGAVGDIKELEKALANENRSPDKQLPCKFSSYGDAKAYIKEKYNTKEKTVLLSCGQRLKDNLHKKKLRLNHRIAFMRSKGDIIFLTFTFTDDVLQNTTPDTRRQKIRRCLSRYNCLYVANIDFGKKNGREHYHAYLQMSRIDIKELRSFYGFGHIEVEPVNRYSSTSSISRYLCKLTNHSLKATNTSQSVIYSRGFIDKKDTSEIDNCEPLPF